MKKVLLLVFLSFSTILSKIELGLSFHDNVFEVSYGLLSHVLERIGCEVVILDAKEVVKEANFVWVANLHVDEGIKRVYCKLPKSQSCLDQSLDLIDLSASSHSGRDEDLMFFE